MIKRLTTDKPTDLQLSKDGIYRWFKRAVNNKIDGLGREEQDEIRQKIGKNTPE